MATTAQKIVAEFLGTFLLVFTVGCNVLGKTPVWAGVSIACVLMVSIYALGGISGANFNPAVSTALFITKSMNGPDPCGMTFSVYATYVLTQILAGVLAAFTYAILFWNAFNLGPTKGFGFLAAGLCELLYTFMLCFVVLNVAAARKYSESKEAVPTNQFAGLAIGFVIIAGAYGAGVVSGGCFNPAVAIGIDTSSAGLGFGWCIVYTLFELLGAAFAAVAFKLVRPGDFAAVPQADKPAETGSIFLSEFLGTFFLVLTVGLNVLGNSQAAAFSIAAALMCMIYALGDVSGAHFNPAVTVAILASGHLRGGLTTNQAVVNICGQLSGAIVAGFMYVLIYDGHSFPLQGGEGAKPTQIGVAEFVFTFVLCYTVLCVVCSEKTKAKTMYGLAIGSCVTVGGFAVGGISGASLNPAVSFGIALTQLSGKQLMNAIGYSCVELLGGVAAAVVARVTHSLQKI